MYDELFTLRDNILESDGQPIKIGPNEIKAAIKDVSSESMEQFSRLLSCSLFNENWLESTKFRNLACVSERSDLNTKESIMFSSSYSHYLSGLKDEMPRPFKNPTYGYNFIVYLAAYIEDTQANLSQSDVDLYNSQDKHNYNLMFNGCETEDEINGRIEELLDSIKFIN